MKKLAWLLLLLFSTSAEAATYYVSPTGSDAAAGTIGAPWLTGQKCANTVVAGDTCLFRGGTYNHSTPSTAFLNVITSGTASARITFQAYPGETPIINMPVVSGLAQTVKDMFGFTIYTNKAYITVDGFKVVGGEGGVQGYLGADNIIVRNMDISYGWNGGIGCWNTCTNWLVEDNTIYHAIQKNYPRGTVSSATDTWGGAITISSNVSDVTFRRNVVYWNHGEGIVTGIGSARVIFEKNVVSDCWSVCIYTDGGNDLIIRDNLIYLTDAAKDAPSIGGVTTANALGIGAAVEPDASFVAALKNLNIHNNVVINTAACFRAFPEEAGHTFSDWFIYNNTCIDNDQGIRIDNTGAPIQNITLRNNIIRARGDGLGGRIVQFVPAPTGTNVFSNNIYDGSGTGVFDLNGSTMGFAAWVTATGDTNSLFTPPLLTSYTIPCRLWNDTTPSFPSGACSISSVVVPGQVDSGSPAINAGIAAIGSCPAPLNCTYTVPYNGSAPDIGAFETWSIANCNVGDVAANKLRCNVQNNADPPVLAPSTTGWTALESGGNKAISSVAVVGTSIIEFTTSANYGSGTSCDLQYATTGSASDSALIGNRGNQRLNTVSAVTCTNTVSGGGSTAVLTQTHGRFRKLYGIESTIPTDWKAAEDTAYTIIPGGAVRVRIKAKATVADPVPFNPTLQYSVDNGAFTTWADTCSVTAYVCALGTTLSLGIVNGSATTEQLTSDLATNVSCAVVLTSSAVPLIDASLNSEWECEYGIRTYSAIPVGTNLRFRMVKDGAVAFDTYSVYPTLTVTNPGFNQF